ncbi:hypothetical protein PTKIN_Ptkin11bG0116700 [Pterospermum kingtungense]
MRLFMMAFDIGAWCVVERGLGVSSNDKEFIKKVQDDAKAKCHLYEALDSHNFNLVVNCSTSKKIWEKLEEMHGEGRNKKRIEEKPCDSQCLTSDKANERERHSLIQNATYLMALEECEVTSNSCNSNLYSFDELQDVFDELAIDF